MPQGGRLGDQHRGRDNDGKMRKPFDRTQGKQGRQWRKAGLQSRQHGPCPKRPDQHAPIPQTLHQQPRGGTKDKANQPDNRNDKPQRDLPCAGVMAGDPVKQDRNLAKLRGGPKPRAPQDQNDDKGRAVHKRCLADGCEGCHEKTRPLLPDRAKCSAFCRVTYG